jgi:hypothetical protein
MAHALALGYVLAKQFSRLGGTLAAAAPALPAAMPLFGANRGALRQLDRYATLRYATLRYATLRYAMLCYAILCYAAA